MFRLFRFFLIFLCSTSLFAKSPNLDSTISAISKTVVSSASENAIIAILDFSSENKKLGEYIRDQLAADIMETGNLRLVTRNHLDLLEKESFFQLSGYVSDETALSICEKLGAQALIFDQINELGKNYRLQVKMIDVETAVYRLFKNYTVSKDKTIKQLTGEQEKPKKEAKERKERIKKGSKRYTFSYEERDPKFSLGVLLEGNLYSVKGIAPCAGLSFDYLFFNCLSIGVKSTFTKDFVSKDIPIFTIETLGVIKYYPFLMDKNSSFYYYKDYYNGFYNEFFSGCFCGLQLGADFINVDNNFKTSFLIAGELGYRLNFERIYFEIYARGGYPVIFAAGLGSGIRL